MIEGTEYFRHKVFPKQVIKKNHTISEEKHKARALAIDGIHVRTGV